MGFQSGGLLGFQIGGKWLLFQTGGLRGFSAKLGGNIWCSKPGFQTGGLLGSFGQTGVPNWGSPWLLNFGPNWGKIFVVPNRGSKLMVFLAPLAKLGFKTGGLLGCWAQLEGNMCCSKPGFQTGGLLGSLCQTGGCS